MLVSKTVWTEGKLRRSGALVLIATLGFGCSEKVAASGAGDFPEEIDILRLVEPGQGEDEVEGQGERLETPILSYADGRGRRVDLIAVVHIGERAYYEELNRRFESYDAVLYELVAERGTRPRLGGEAGGGGSVLSFFQNKLKDLLALEFQLDLIDYSADNMVHADVSPSELDALFEGRDDSLLASLFRAALKASQPENASPMSTFALLQALFAKDRATEFKRLLARMFEDIDKLVAGFEDESGSSVLVTERNARAMEVLAEELEAGRKRLAIFYGAAHMDDFHERLLDLGFVGQSEEWLVAWAITPVASGR